jgi:hypothetical protein
VWFLGNINIFTFIHIRTVVSVLFFSIRFFVYPNIGALRQASNYVMVFKKSSVDEKIVQNTKHLISQRIEKEKNIQSKTLKKDCLIFNDMKSDTNS